MASFVVWCLGTEISYEMPPVKFSVIRGFTIQMIVTYRKKYITTLFALHFSISTGRL